MSKEQKTKDAIAETQVQISNLETTIASLKQDIAEAIIDGRSKSHIEKQCQSKCDELAQAKANLDHLRSALPGAIQFDLEQSLRELYIERKRLMLANRDLVREIAPLQAEREKNQKSYHATLQTITELTHRMVEYHKFTNAQIAQINSEYTVN